MAVFRWHTATTAQRQADANRMEAFQAEMDRAFRLERDAEAPYADMPDAVDLALWPHCHCLDPVVFGHRGWCRVRRDGIDAGSSALQ